MDSGEGASGVGVVGVGTSVVGALGVGIVGVGGLLVGGLLVGALLVGELLVGADDVCVKPSVADKATIKTTVVKEKVVFAKSFSRFIEFGFLQANPQVN